MKIDINDIVGKKFNKLLVLSFNHSKPHPNPTKGQFYFYKCQCECGKITIVKRERIINGITKSCGCINNRATTHGLSKTRLFRIWSSMLNRCYNTNVLRYKNYGGRGIKVCDEWLIFKPFYDWAMANGYNDTLTIDRINVDGNYEPNNCHFSNAKQQANNRTNNNLIFYNNETHTLAEWAEILKINRSTLWYRLKRGWSIKRAFSTPIK